MVLQLVHLGPARVYKSCMPSVACTIWGSRVQFQTPDIVYAYTTIWLILFKLCSCVLPLLPFERLTGVMH